MIILKPFRLFVCLLNWYVTHLTVEVTLGSLENGKKVMWLKLRKIKIETKNQESKGHGDGDLLCHLSATLSIEHPHQGPRLSPSDLIIEIYSLVMVHMKLDENLFPGTHDWTD